MATLGHRFSIAWGYSPESPEVRQMVDRGVRFLEKAQHEEVGGMCLVGLAIYKATESKSHPKIQEAVGRARSLAAQVRQRGVGEHCYNEAVACIFLCELDPDQYRGEIEALLTGMLQRQTPTGMWTYQGRNQTDTSQTQYGMLCLWSGHNAGFTASVPAVERALHWLMRTQSEDGSFCYQPRDPGRGGQRLRQPPGTHSMSVAGTGSLYVGAHLLGIGAHSQPTTESEERELPPALQKVEEKKEKKFVPLRPQTVNPALLRAAGSLGDGWVDENFATENKFDPGWTYYYLYGLERYKSFKEIVNGEDELEPDWYNRVVEHLKKEQKADGSWSAGGGCRVAGDTAFAVLFLVRSTQKTIKKAVTGEGILIGGKGLPTDIANARMQGGQVVTPQMVREVDDLLSLLEDVDDQAFDATALPGGLSLDADLTKRTSQLEKLREMVTNENFHARLAAVKTLGRARQLDNVPALIYALSDPDWRVAREARDGLRFISRKFTGFGMPEQPTPEEARSAQDKWKQWYLSIRPEGEFLE
jgi:hypothetical protein